LLQPTALTYHNPHVANVLSHRSQPLLPHVWPGVLFGAMNSAQRHRGTAFVSFVKRRRFSINFLRRPRPCFVSRGRALRLWRARVDAALQLGRPRARLHRVTGHSYSYSYQYQYQVQCSAQVPLGHTGTGAGAGACRAHWDRRSSTCKYYTMLLAWRRRTRALLCLYSLHQHMHVACCFAGAVCCKTS
jgi:hypothetical protein